MTHQSSSDEQVCIDFEMQSGEMREREEEWAGGLYRLRREKA
jgi:hypothetical protein